jgi:hypothetical protein
MSTVTDIASRRVLTPKERLEALLAARMNDERAQACSAQQPALKAMFEMNAELFRRFAT